MSDTISPLRDHGVTLRRAGFAVLPSQGKTPLVNSFTTMPHPPGVKAIERWGEKWPQADLVYVPGLSGRTGLVVVDGDSAGAVDDIRARFGDTPGRVRTRRGMHLLYDARGRDVLRDIGHNVTSLRKFGIDADLKHGRQIVVAPPSRHEDDWDFHYKWDGCDEAVIKDLPPFQMGALLDLIQSATLSRKVPSEDMTARGDRRSPFRDASRGLGLNDHLFPRGLWFDTLDDMLDYARTWNMNLENKGYPPLPDEEVVNRAEQVWNDRHKVIPMQGHRGTAVTDADEIRGTAGEFRHGADVLALAMLFRAEHQARVARGETFEINILAMVEARVFKGWSARRYRNARDGALQMGLIRLVREEEYNQRAQYTLCERQLTPSVSKRTGKLMIG